MTILQKLDRIPPCMCRLLARKAHGTKGLSHSEIALKARISVSMVSWLSYRTTWANVPVGTAVAFAMACGVNHLRAERQLDYLRRRKLTHVDNAPTLQKRFYNRLFNLKRV